MKSFQQWKQTLNTSTRASLDFTLLGLKVTVGVLFIIMVLGVLMWQVFRLGDTDYQQQLAFEHRDAFVQQCLESERYSRDECIRLAGQAR